MAQWKVLGVVTLEPHLFSPRILLTVDTSALSGVVLNRVMKHRNDQKASLQPPLPYKFRQRQSGLGHFGKDQLSCLAGRRIYKSFGPGLSRCVSPGLWWI